MFRTKPRLFRVIRHRDLKHISGVGKVIDGVVFADGHVVVQWQSETPSISIFRNLEDFQNVHLKPIFNENEFLWYDGYEPKDEVIEALQQVADFVMSYRGGRLNDRTKGELVAKIIAIQRQHSRQKRGGLSPSYVRILKRNQKAPVRLEDGDA